MKVQTDPCLTSWKTSVLTLQTLKAVRMWRILWTGGTQWSHGRTRLKMMT